MSNAPVAPTPRAPKARKLTGKQSAFVDQYFLCRFNGTEAALQAGYAGDRHALSVVAAENLVNPRIKAAIEARLAEYTMAADEVLVRLAEHARGSLADFFFIGEEEVTLQEAVIQEGEKTIIHTATVMRPVARLDLEQAARLGKLHLVKKYKVGNDSSVEIGLYDAQAALELIGKYHKLFTDKVEHTGPNGEAIVVREVEVRLATHGSVDNH